MLDRLDCIPWQCLHHAHGSADDVPGLLRALAQSGKQQEDALRELFGNIWHQGTVYEASSYAVPFLVELAAKPGLTRRDEILGLIGALAKGNSYLAVHAQPGLKMGEPLRQEADFEERLENELQSVRITRRTVFEHRDVVCKLLKDTMPMVRAGAAHVLSQFPEQLSELGFVLRLAVKEEKHPLVLAGMLWCLGALRDDSPEAFAILDTAVRGSADPRQTFAASIALYRISGELHSAALPVYRQLAAATWFAESFLAGVPWDFSAEVPIEELLATVEPDPAGATRTLLMLLNQAHAQEDSYPAVVHDLLQLNFTEGNWRECGQLTSTQKEVLRCVVETEDAWKDTRRLWFLIQDGARRISGLTPSDIQNVRDEMRALLGRTAI
jgi:hypothetical protein